MSGPGDPQSRNAPERVREIHPLKMTTMDGEPEIRLRPGEPVILLRQGEAIVGVWQGTPLAFIHPRNRRELAAEALAVILEAYPDVDLDPKGRVIRGYTCPAGLAARFEGVTPSP